MTFALTIIIIPLIISILGSWLSAPILKGLQSTPRVVSGPLRRLADRLVSDTNDLVSNPDLQIAYFSEKLAKIVIQGVIVLFFESIFVASQFGFIHPRICNIAFQVIIMSLLFYEFFGLATAVASLATVAKQVRDHVLSVAKERRSVQQHAGDLGKRD